MAVIVIGYDHVVCRNNSGSRPPEPVCLPLERRFQRSIREQLCFQKWELTEAEAASYETVTITNDMEHQYLDESLGSSVVGSHSLSSVLLIPQESGAGLSRRDP